MQVWFKMPSNILWNSVLLTRPVYRLHLCCNLVILQGSENAHFQAPTQARDSTLVASKDDCFTTILSSMAINACTIFSSIKLARSLHSAYGAQNVLRMATGLLTAICTVYGIVCLLKKSICYLTGNEGYDVCMQKAIYYMILECRKQRETEERDFVRNRAYLV